MPRALLLPLAIVACSAGNAKDPTPGNINADSGGTDSSFLDVSGLEDAPPNDGSTIIPDPTTCAQAAASKTYVGCDFWPTVTDNMVRPDFDYAVVVANTGDSTATIEVTRAGMSAASVKVAPNSLEKIYLPWVDALKGANYGGVGGFKVCASDIKTTTVRAKDGAYHLVSNVPVAVYQFNAIEYAGKGGPPGKDWSKCLTACLGVTECYSYTNDASLLLPSTAWTGNYRVAGPDQWDNVDEMSGSKTKFPPYFVITGMTDGTKVTVKMSSTGSIVAGGGIAAVAAGGSVTFDVAMGEAIEVIGSGDLSGTLIKATNPIQVIAGIACANVPKDVVACDHLEESLLPVETLGKRYFVTVPTGPAGTPLGHVVKLVGNVDGTKLTYTGTPPAGAPATIDAGQVVNLGVVKSDFEIVGDHELTVTTFQMGAGPISGSRLGDPSQSMSSSVEQYRLKYVFLAPDDYDVNYADVIQPMTATLTLDGAPVTAKPTALASGYGITRIKLGAGAKGSHILTATEPVGLQVQGYGAYTSYQYPGGLNLGRIAPIPIK
jgi:hypothetical protein